MLLIQLCTLQYHKFVSITGWKGRKFKAFPGMYSKTNHKRHADIFASTLISNISGEEKSIIISN